MTDAEKDGSPTTPDVGKPAIRVPRFASWFQTVNMCAAPGLADGLIGTYTLRRVNCASEEGAAKALELVQRFAPGARIATEQYAGPWSPDKPIYHIQLPNGERMNAGLVLDRYYQHGSGAHGLSDSDLESEIRLLIDESGGVHQD